MTNLGGERQRRQRQVRFAAEEKVRFVPPGYESPWLSPKELLKTQNDVFAQVQELEDGLPAHELACRGRGLETVRCRHAAEHVQKIRAMLISSVMQEQNRKQMFRSKKEKAEQVRKVSEFMSQKARWRAFQQGRQDERRLLEIMQEEMGNASQ